MAKKNNGNVPAAGEAAGTKKPTKAEGLKFASEEVIADLLKHNKDAKELHFTSDGEAFLDVLSANRHASTLEDKTVESYFSDSASEVIVEKVSIQPDFIIDEFVNLVNSGNEQAIEALKALSLSQESTSKNGSQGTEGAEGSGK